MWPWKASRIDLYTKGKELCMSVNSLYTESLYLTESILLTGEQENFLSSLDVCLFPL